MESQWCYTTDMQLAGDAKILVENWITRHVKQKNNNKKTPPDENSECLP